MLIEINPLLLESASYSSRERGGGFYPADFFIRMIEF